MLKEESIDINANSLMQSAESGQQQGEQPLIPLIVENLEVTTKMLEIILKYQKSPSKKVKLYDLH